MIPVSLDLQNFLSYGEATEPLDFTRFRLACLSGPNGHGKSALLDAITWALWGQARKTPGGGKPDENLLRIGAMRMMVEFVFDLSGDRFRVIRSFELRKSGRGKSDLQFQHIDTATDTPHPLTCKTLTETQALINQTLRMDYGTFINSSFLLQGRADEFTRKKPSERKEILAEVLGLSRYEELRQKARERSRQHEKNLLHAGGRVEEIDRELEQKQEIEQRFQSTTEQHQVASEQAKQLETEVTNLRERKKKIESQKVQFEEGKKRARLQQNEIEAAQRNLNQLSTQRVALEKVIANREDIESRHKQFENCSADLKRFDAALQTHISLEKKIGEYQKQLDTERNRLTETKVRQQAEVKSIQASIADADRIIERKESIEKTNAEYLKLKTELTQQEKTAEQHSELKKNIEVLDKKIESERAKLEMEKACLETRQQGLAEQASREDATVKSLQSTRKQWEKLQARAQRQEEVKEKGSALNARLENYEKDLKQLAETIAEHREKLALLEHSEEAECPLCKSGLDEQRRGQLLATLQKEATGFEQRRVAREKEMKSMQTERDQLRQEFRRLAQDQAEREKVQQELGRLQGQLTEIQAVKKQLAEVQKLLNEIQTRLNEKRYAEPEQEKRKELEGALQDLAFIPDALTRLRKQLDELGAAPGELQRLQEAEKNRDALHEKLARIEKELKETTAKIESGNFAQEVRSQLKESEVELKKLAYQSSEHDRIRSQRESLSGVVAEWTRLQDSLSQLPQIQKQCQGEESALSKRQEELKRLEAKLETLKPDLDQLAPVSGALNEAEEKSKRAMAERDRLNVDQEKLKSEKERLDRLEGEKKKLANQTRTDRKEKRLYDLLVEALGPKGIQALIIENAVPEIQDEANRILSRLTNNRTQVAFESLREKRTGGLIETLDIKISDEMGIRDYELYSGGEAFRTDLAIRIALSRLLARRAGTRLQTLVIDEGFGTQDSEGLENIVQVIHDIADEFEKIIVVTHLDSLKDAFPVRIEVTKSPERGSRFEVVGSVG